MAVEGADARLVVVVEVVHVPQSAGQYLLALVFVLQSTALKTAHLFAGSTRPLHIAVAVVIVAIVLVVLVDEVEDVEQVPHMTGQKDCTSSPSFPSFSHLLK